jgi:hypothetical protein
MDIEPAHSVAANYRRETVVDLQRALAVGNRFTDEELAVNRENRIAKTQVPLLLGRALRPLAKASWVLLGSLLLLVVMYVFLMFSNALVPRSLLDSVPRSFLALEAMKLSGYGVFTAVILVALAVVALPGALFNSICTLFSLALDFAAGRALCIEGRTTTSWTNEDGSVMEVLNGERAEHYEYVVQNQYISVTQEGYQALREWSGSACKVYVTPRSKLLLSLEPVKMRKASRIGGTQFNASGSQADASDRPGIFAHANSATFSTS